MWDAIVAGAGPAGSIAATVLARAGARVLLLDRARFPRDKLCGDSLNPGTVDRLQRLHPGIWSGPRRLSGVPIEGMLVTGPFATRIEARYPPGLRGLVLQRRELDRWLLDEAIRAGATFDEGVVVRCPRMTDGSRAARGPVVTGVIVRSRAARDMPLGARITIAADGRRSALASALGLTGPASQPARWAVGAYFDGVTGMSSVGEMHVRAGRYLGVAPIGGAVANACLVAPARALQRAGGPERALLAMLAGDELLADRFSGARMLARPVVMGPLAVNATAAGAPGLLLAGDAAGFVDPMTGDGLRFAVEGAELAAGAALDALAHGTAEPHLELARGRRAAFAWKWRINRTLRSLVERPAAVVAAARAAAVVPGIVRALVTTAGDCAGAHPLEETP